MLYSKIFKKIVILAVFTAQIGQVFGATEIDAADIVAGGFFAKASRVFTNAVHELGHALTTRFLFGKDTARINLGSRDAAVWYANKFVTLKKDMIFPKNCQYAQTEISVKLPQQGLKPVAVMAAGPAAGLALAGCMAYAAYRSESYENKNIAPILYGTAAAQSYFQLEQFLPRVDENSGLKSDGERISEILKFSENAKRTFTRSVRGAMAASVGLAGAKLYSIYSNADSKINS
jgi:hypothetical protein